MAGIRCRETGLMRNPTTSEKEIQRAEANRQSGMLVVPAKASQPTVNSAKHQEPTSDHSDGHRRGDRAGANIFFNDAERPQELPEWGPNQQTQNGENHEHRQQYTGNQSQNRRQRPERAASRQHEGTGSQTRCDPAMEQRLNDLPICRILGLSECYCEDSGAEDYERRTNPRPRRLLP